MKQKVLVIGGSGYIGYAVIKKLLSENIHIINYDCLMFKGQKNAFKKRKNYKFLKADLSEIEKYDHLLKDVTDVVLLAGLVGDPLTKKYPVLSKKVNEKSILKCIKFFNKKNIDRFIFISTCSNYGLIKGNQKANEKFRLRPLSIYAKNKVRIEKFLLSKKNKFLFSPLVLRFSTAFGFSNRMRFDLTINQFTIELLKKRKIKIYDPQTWRPYCHIKDFAEIIYKFLLEDKFLINKQVFNIGSNSNNFTKNKIIHLLKKKISKAKFNFVSGGTDKRNYRVDFKKIHKKFDHKFISVSKGIDEIILKFKKGFFKDYTSKNQKYGNYVIKYEKNFFK